MKNEYLWVFMKELRNMKLVDRSIETKVHTFLAQLTSCGDHVMEFITIQFFGSEIGLKSD